MTRLYIKSLSSGGVITNYHCVSKCGHCLYNCGPHRTKAYLEAALAEKIFHRIKSLGCRSVHIGGGEPLLHPAKLIKILKVAKNTGVSIDYVETNSAWFINSDQAETVLKNLHTVGAQTLLISISPFHNAYIPFARVKGVIAACRKVGMNIFPWVNAFVSDLSRLNEHLPHGMEEFQAMFGVDYLKRILDRYWIHLGGRALETFRPVYPQHPLKKILEQSPSSCVRPLNDTSHFHLDLFGGYIPGLCAGLTIAMEDLGRPLPVGKYPLLDVLTATGICGLYDFARRSFGYKSGGSTFLNHCDLCTHIRTFLIQQKKEQFLELAPEGFYAAGALS
jgi:hypothetical protein